MNRLVNNNNIFSLGKDIMKKLEKSNVVYKNWVVASVPGRISEQCHGKLHKRVFP